MKRGDSMADGHLFLPIKVEDLRKLLASPAIRLGDEVVGIHVTGNLALFRDGEQIGYLDIREKPPRVVLNGVRI